MFTYTAMLVIFGLVVLSTLHSEGWGTAIRYCGSLGMMLSGLGIILPILGL